MVKATGCAQAESSAGGVSLVDSRLSGPAPGRVEQKGEGGRGRRSLGAWPSAAGVPRRRAHRDAGDGTI